MAAKAGKSTRKSAPSEIARKFAVGAARLAEDGNCSDIVVLDLHGVSPVTDYFVIATGISDRQMRSVAEDIIEYGESVGQKVYRSAGMDSADWVVLDFVDAVVHLFDEQHRHYYDLELIWGECPRVRWRRPKRKAAAPADGE